MEVTENTAIAIKEANLEEGRCGPVRNDPEASISEELWTSCEDLSLQLCVTIPLQEMTLHSLASIKPGYLLKSTWSIKEDVPLSTNGVFLANVCFEPSGGNLGVRISDFNPRVASVPEFYFQSTEPAVNQDTLNALRLKTVLCFGTAQMTVRDLLELTMGDSVTLDRPVNAPVKVTVKGSVVASGRLVVAGGSYAVEILNIGQMLLALQRC